MRKVFSVLVLSALVSGALWAQITLPPAGDLQFQALPRSPVKDVSGRFSTDVDNYLGVTDWNGVAETFANTYFFLGGYADAGASSGVRGGFAKKLGSAYLAFYLDGNLTNGKGDNNGKDGDEKVTNGSLTWNNWFGFLFGNEAIGGIRFDLQLGDGSSAATSGEAGGGKTDKNLGPLVTTLQWGKSLGTITPFVTLGFKWPGSEITTPKTGDKTENYNNAAFLLGLELDIGNFAVENSLVLDFGATNTTGSKTNKTSGYIYDNIGLVYYHTTDITEKLQFKANPRIDVVLAGQDNKIEPDSGDAYNTSAPQFWFQVKPSSQLALKLQANEKLAFYTGLKLTLLTFTTESHSDGKAQGGGDLEDKTSKWELEGIDFDSIGGTGALQLAATFAFNPAVSLEASVESGLLHLGIPGKGDSFVRNPFDVVSANKYLTAASLVVNFKPGYAGAE